MHQSTQILYEIHDSFTGLLSLVNNFIQQEDNEEFFGTWMMIVSFEAPENSFKVFFARGSCDIKGWTLLLLCRPTISKQSLLLMATNPMLYSPINVVHYQALESEQTEL